MYCDMLLTLSTCNSRAGTAARVYALRFPGRRHPDANVFPRLEHRLCERGSVTPMQHVIAGRSLSVRTQSLKNPQISYGAREPPRSSHEITRELRLPKPKFLEVIHDVQVHPYHYSRSGHLFPRDRLLRMQLFRRLLHQYVADEYFHIILVYCEQTNRVLRVRVCWMSSGVTYGHRIILVLSASGGIRFSTATAFGLESSVTLLAPMCFLPGCVLSGFTGNCSTQGCLKMWFLPMRQKLWLQHSGAPSHCGKVANGDGWTQHI
jgi:hypothetical protein